MKLIRKRIEKKNKEKDQKVLSLKQWFFYPHWFQCESGSGSGLLSLKQWFFYPHWFQCESGSDADADPDPDPKPKIEKNLQLKS